jgi:hypothetical protein
MTAPKPKRRWIHLTLNSRNRIRRAAIVALLFGANVLLFVAAMTALPLWAVCALSAFGAAIGVIVKRKYYEPGPVTGALAGSAIAIFSFFGFIMSVIARWLG